MPFGVSGSVPVIVMGWLRTIAMHRSMRRLVGESGRAYTAGMSSVADDLRAQRTRELLLQSPAERVDLSLRLGDEDVAVVCAARAMSEHDARLMIQRSRQVGRRPSRVACR